MTTPAWVSKQNIIWLIYYNLELKYGKRIYNKKFVAYLSFIKFALSKVSS